jgi:phosphopantothenoylcysteine decarboxylase / phosphopantothenate---cysteine ligase
MLANKTIVLGITGSIAAYKGADLASKLTQAGAKVEVILTEAAMKFVSPVTFRSVTGRPVVYNMFELSGEFSVEHVALAEAADVVVVAPATADIIAKIAAGIASDMVCTTVVATRSPIIIAPAMHTGMWENKATQENVKILKARGVVFVDPEEGHLASGGVGQGRLAEVQEIIAAINQVLAKNGDLAKKHIVITAGGTQEAIDPVRFVGNRSSGKMGYALAEAARDRGARVTLISAPTGLVKPVGTAIINVESAIEMRDAVVKATADADVLIMAAAVADYQPKRRAEQKIKKEAAGTVMTLELVRTPDILAKVKGNFIKVGFAAETENVIENARRKLESKKVDLFVANDVSVPDSGFAVDTNRVTLIDRSDKVEELPLMMKREVADKVLDRVVKIMGQRLAK